MEIVGPLKIPKKWDKKGIHEISQISLFHLTTNSRMVGEVHLLISSQLFHRPCSPFIRPCIPATSSHKILSTSPSLAVSYFLLLQGVSYKLYDIVQFHPCHFFPKVPPCPFHIFFSTYFSPEPYHFPPVSLLLLCTGS